MLTSVNVEANDDEDVKTRSSCSLSVVSSRLAAQTIIGGTKAKKVTKAPTPLSVFLNCCVAFFAPCVALMCSLFTD